MQDVLYTAAAASGDAAVNQIVLSALASYIQELAKNSKAPFLAWIGHCMPWMNRIVSAVIAALIAAGFTASYDSHGGTLVINGLTLQGVLLFFWMWLRSLVVQHTTYKLIQTSATAKMISRATGAAKLPEPPTPLI